MLVEDSFKNKGEHFARLKKLVEALDLDEDALFNVSLTTPEFQMQYRADAKRTHAGLSASIGAMCRSVNADRKVQNSSYNQLSGSGASFQQQLEIVLDYVGDALFKEFDLWTANFLVQLLASVNFDADESWGFEGYSRVWII